MGFKSRHAVGTHVSRMHSKKHEMTPAQKSGQPAAGAPADGMHFSWWQCPFCLFIKVDDERARVLGLRCGNSSCMMHNREVVVDDAGDDDMVVDALDFVADDEDDRMIQLPATAEQHTHDGQHEQHAEMAVSSSSSSSSAAAAAAGPGYNRIRKRAAPVEDDDDVAMVPLPAAAPQPQPQPQPQPPQLDRPAVGPAAGAAATKPRAEPPRPAAGSGGREDLRERSRPGRAVKYVYASVPDYSLARYGPKEPPVPPPLPKSLPPAAAAATSAAAVPTVAAAPPLPQTDLRDGLSGHKRERSEHPPSPEWRPRERPRSERDRDGMGRDHRDRGRERSPSTGSDDNDHHRRRKDAASSSTYDAPYELILPAALAAAAAAPQSTDADFAVSVPRIASGRDTRTTVLLHGLPDDETQVRAHVVVCAKSVFIHAHTCPLPDLRQTAAAAA
jgi:hypothetical protein